MQEQIGKREQNKARKRAEIVAIATRTFLGQGYAATSMSGIADELGGSKATLWAHFASKEELFAAVVDGQVDTFARDIAEVLTSQTFSLPALRRACLRFLECLLRDDAVRLFRLVLSDGERFPEITETFYSRGPARVRHSMKQFFATRFEDADALRLTRVVANAITGYRSDILLRPDRPGKASREIFVDSLISSIAWPAFAADDEADEQPAD
jgi:TetR/AcrR family transcriptional regulator, mexJK operon transcriptional repressor